MRLLPLTLTLALVLSPAAGALGASPEDLVRRGNELYRGEKFDEAAKAYNEALQRNPSSPLILYNLGTALARSGETEPAEQALGQAARNPGSPLRRDAWFNTGVVQAAPVIDQMQEQGGGGPMIQTPQDTRQQIEQLEKALGSFRQAILADSSDSYAIYNYEIVKEALEALRQQQNQQNQQDQQKSDEQQDQQSDQQNQDQQNQGQQNQEQQNEGDQQQQPQEQKPEEKEGESQSEKPSEQQGEEKEQEGQQQGMEGTATPTPRPEPPKPQPQPGAGSEGESEPPKLTPEQMDALRLLNLLEDESPEQFKRLFRFRGDSAPRPGRDW